MMGQSEDVIVDKKLFDEIGEAEGRYTS